MIEPLLRERGLRLKLEISDRDAVVCADRRRMRQAVLILLSNAVKYNRGGGDVTFAVVGAGPGEVRISVSDQGQGISAELLPRLFVPFDRLGAERGHTAGTGLGLTVTRALVEAMGGSLTVESQPGEGSTFTVTLPRVSAPPKPEDDDPLSAPAAHRSLSVDADGRQRVLCIEDNPTSMRRSKP